MKKKPKKNPRGRFVMLYQDLIESVAWKSLNGDARSLYLNVAAKYNGKNNGRISFSAREAAPALNISRATTARAFRNLIDRGFITIAKRSGFNLKRGQDRATEYRLTEYPCNVTGKRAGFKFKHWRRGKNGSENISRSHQRDRSVSPERPVGLTSETEGDSGLD